MISKAKKKKVASIENKVLSGKGNWTVGESEMLIARMLSNVPLPDNAKFVVSLDKLSWNDIAFNHFTAEDCKMKWETISKEIRKFRTLTEILQDAREYVKDPYKNQIKKHPDYPKRPLTPYFRFFVENRDEYARKHSNMSNLQVTAILSKLYRELSPSLKEKYTKEWKKETEIYKVAMAKFKNEHPDYFTILSKSPKEPRQPAVIYKDEKLNDYTQANPSMTSKECADLLKKQYKDLPDQEKYTYIAKSLKEEEQYEEDIQKYNQTHTDGNKKKKRNKNALTKQERELSDKLQGRPKKPPSNGYNLFCTEMMPTLTELSSQKRIVECGRLWNLKTNKEKQDYHNRYLSMKDKYEENYKNFYEKLTPEQKLKETELRDSKLKSNKRRAIAASNSTTNTKKTKIEKQSTSSSSSSDDESDDLSESDNDVDLADTSDDDDDSADSQEEEASEDDDVTKADEDENFRRLAPARPTTPISALFIYQKAQRKKAEAQFPNLSSNEITRLLARRYHELPEHKKHKYLVKEREQKALYNNKIQEYLKEGKKNGFGNKIQQPSPVTGEQIFFDKNISYYLKKHKDKEEAESALHTAWSKMNKQKKQPYIKLAQTRNQERINAYQTQQQQQNTDSNIDKVKTVTKSKLSKKKIKFENEPKKPPSSGYMLFSATYISSLSHLAHGEKFKELGRLWNELDSSKKKTFSDEAKKRFDKYKKELALWIKELPPDVAAQYQAQHMKKTKPASSEKLKEDEDNVDAKSDENILTKKEIIADTSDSDDTDSSSSGAETEDDESSDSDDDDDDEDESGSSSDSTEDDNSSPSED